MAIGNKPSPRRREVRRSVPKPVRRLPIEIDRRQLAWAVLYAAVFTLCAGFIALSGQRPSYRVGQRLTEPVVARVDFEAENKTKTAEQRNRARDNTPNHYVPNEQYRERLKQQFDRLIALGKIDEFEQIDDNSFALTRSGHDELKKLVDEEGHPTKQWVDFTTRFTRELFNLPIIRAEDLTTSELEKSLMEQGMTARHPDPADPSQPEARRFPTEIVLLSRDAAKRAEQIKKLSERIDKLAAPFPWPLRETITKIVLDIPQSMYSLDAQETLRRKNKAVEGVRVLVPFKANEVLAPAGSEIHKDTTPSGETITVSLLEAEQQAYEEELRRNHPSQLWLRVAGQFGFMALLAVGLWAYLFAFNGRVTRNPMRGLAITTLLILCLGIAAGATELAPILLFGAAAFPTLLVAIVLAIAYDQRFALALGAMQALVVTYSLGQSAAFFVVLLVGVGVAMAQLREVRTRSKLVKVGLWTGLALALATLVTGFAQRPDYLGRILLDSALTFGAGVAVGMFVQSILPTIERVFKVTTSMTLKELNDASHPLLRRLAEAAPGTYQHSLRLADITEAAAEAIGADGLLCRVGAMYHDIGKMNKPGYFIENQGGGPNRHAKLSPAMSVLIIVGHVKDGIEMAREYGLPRVLRHFIESHHGTTLVEYFYHAAQKRRESNDQPAPTEFEFRYPGPKPSTKEAAILMLGDGIESAARSLDEPTPNRIEQLVHAIAQKRLMDGQFDECNLTLKELHQIEAAMTKMLCAVYHSRIKYPDAGKRQTEEGAPTPPAAAASG